MASDDNRLKIIAGGAVAFAVLIAATYGLVRHVPLLMGSSPPPRAASGAGTAGGVSGYGRATITGVVTRPDGAPQMAGVRLMRVTDTLLRPAPQARGRAGGSGRGFGPLSATTGPDGRFTLSNVPAGAFWLVAHAEVVAEAPALPTHLWGIRDVASNGRSTTETTLALVPGGTITGLLEFKSAAGVPRPEMSTTTVTLAPADGRTQAQLALGYPDAKPDGFGAFVVAAVPPGRYTLDAPAFRDWSLDSATLDGRDWIDRAFDVPPGWGTRRATLVFSDRPNAVTGVVRHASGAVAGFTLVMVFSSDPSMRQASRRVQAARTDALGRFTLSGLPTGAYFVAAATDLPPERWYTAESFVELTPRAVPMSFGHGETKTVTLQIR